jgi:hypothetical protein
LASHFRGMDSKGSIKMKKWKINVDVTH